MPTCRKGAARVPPLAFLWCWAAALWLAAPAVGQEPPPIPPSPPDGVTPAITGPDKIKPHTIGVFTLPPTGQTVIDPVPGLDVQQRGAELFVTGPAGAYTLSGFWVDFESKKISRLSKAFTIGEPKPPTPPVPPGPPNPLAERFQREYAAESNPQKSTHVAYLAAVYTEAAKLADDAALTTCEQLLTAVRKAVASGVPGDSLKGVRTAIGAELSARLPTAADASLTPDVRAKAKAAFADVAAALKLVQ